MSLYKMPVFLLCALLLLVGSQVLGAPVPDDSDGWDSVKNVFNKAKDSFKSSLDSASDKITEIGENIKKSTTYEKVSSELHNVGEKISKAGEDLKDTDAYKNVKDTLNKGVEKLKDKFDD